MDELRHVHLREGEFPDDGVLAKLTAAYERTALASKKVRYCQTVRPMEAIVEVTLQLLDGAASGCDRLLGAVDVIRLRNVVKFRFNV